MPGTPSIRWTGSQRRRLETAVRRYNASLSHARRKNPEAAPFMPSTKSAVQLRGEITSARQLNRVVNSLNRASSSKVFELTQLDSGTVTTRYTLREAQIARSVENRRKAVEARRRGLTEAEVERASHMKSIGYYDVLPTKSVSEMTASQLDRLIERSIAASSVNQVDKVMGMMGNYLTALGTTQLTDFSVIQNNVVPIIQEIMREDPAYLLTVYQENPDVVVPDFPYDDMMYRSMRAYQLNKTWTEVYDDWIQTRA